VAVDVLRTPDESFAGLADYPFAPRYLEVPAPDGTPLRMHCVDEGPRRSDVVVLLHGEPTWSYLWRQVVLALVAAGHRAVAPDLIGFGRSDKPARPEDYSYERHVGWVRAFLDALRAEGAGRITLVCHDWGGLIGLRIVGEEPERFAAVVACNTFLPTGDHDPGEAFLRWQKFAREVPELPVGKIVMKGCARPLAAAAMAAYEAPFPAERYKAGARIFPSLVPVQPDDPASAPNRRAWEGLMRFERPFLTAFGDSDPITRGADRFLQAAIPGARGQKHATIAQAGHFLQEDDPQALSAVLLELLRG
jgi:haloalkane dehalogenase